MGRKQSSEPAPDPHGRVTLVNLKGPLVDREYLDRVTRKSGVPLSTIVRRGIALWVAKHGHEMPPDEWIEADIQPVPAKPPTAPTKRKPKGDG